VFIVPGVLLAVGLIWWRKHALWRRAERSHPVREGQAVWGLAAFYTGETFGLGPSGRVYRAARPEWLKALVEANPDQVDDATYQRLVGVARPSGETARPFAG